MWLTPNDEMNASESPVNRPSQIRNINLGKMNIDCGGSVHSSHTLPVNNRKGQLNGKSRVDATLISARIHQRRQQTIRYARRAAIACLKIRVEAYLNTQSRAEAY